MTERISAGNWELKKESNRHSKSEKKGMINLTEDV
jgi:hypothetical protein